MVRVKKYERKKKKKTETTITRQRGFVNGREYYVIETGGQIWEDADGESYKFKTHEEAEEFIEENEDSPLSVFI